MDLHSAVPGLVRHRRGEHEVLDRGGCQQGITLVLGCACTPLQLLARRVVRKRQEQPAGAQRGSSARVGSLGWHGKGQQALSRCKAWVQELID